MEYIDIHSHILPGLDDGALNTSQTIQMLQIAMTQNIRCIIATPHYKSYRPSANSVIIRAKVEKLNLLCVQNNIPIEIFPGNEIMYCEECLDLLNRGELCTLADSNHILVEFLPDAEYLYIRNAAYELISAGYIPVLAHIERYRCLYRKTEERLRELCNLGCKMQINAVTVTSRKSADTKAFLRKTMDTMLIHFVATDAHSDTARAPFLNECSRLLEKKYGRDYMQRLLYENAKALFQEKVPPNVTRKGLNEQSDKEPDDDSKLLAMEKALKEFEQKLMKNNTRG